MPTATLHELIAEATRRLIGAGIPPDSAAFDAELLARHVLGWGRAEMIVRRREPAPSSFGEAFDALIAQRASHVPVAYLTGRREFWGLEFEVSPEVLIPRPETELVVEETLRELPGRSTPLRIVDVGTGSGCIAIALAHERPEARVLAIDRSMAAARVAARNAARLGVGGRVRVCVGDLLSAVAAPPAVPLDAIVSNPPYVPDGSSDVAVDVRRHEPAGALYGGPDGLDVIRRLVDQAAIRLRAGGLLVFEFGAGQSEAIEELLTGSAAWSPPAIRKDLQGIPRVAVARRRE